VLEDDDPSVIVQRSPNNTSRVRMIIDLGS
jgi:hypothetical protein